MAATACGRLDIMVHNAAAFGRSSIREMDHATLDRLFKHQRESLLHADSGVAATHAQARRGRIIITSSVTGPKVSMPGSGAYAVSKAAVTGFIHTAAIELAPDNITVNAIEPGYIDTPGLSGLKARFGAERISHFIPAKRLGRPEEIAGPMVFLASDEASYITGETIVVDGGARLPESPLFAG
jgi:3-oxoacyl-[acyl-carrier protein] reductase